MSHDFGFLTLATPGDYLKAIGLALSLRVSNPGIPVAVACAPQLRPLVERHFDVVVPETPGLRGFVHKVHLDLYSPWQSTMFFDSDVLVFKPVLPYLERWGMDRPYAACGNYLDEGVSPFGMDRAAVLRQIGKERLVVVDGAGHGYFRKPQCTALFETARDITRRYAQFAPGARYADEDVINAAMTMLDLAPAPYEDFFARHLSIVPGTLEMDASRALCRFVARHNGEPFEPCMMHFANNEGAVDYTRQLLRLFARFDVPTSGLIRQGMSDHFDHRVRVPLSRWVRGLLGEAGMRPSRSS